MTLEYNHDERLKALAPILDEYTEWFMQLLRRIMYPKDTQEGQVFSKPSSFLQWLDLAEQEKFQADILERLTNLHSDLSVQADKLINESMKGADTPEYKEFDALMTLFEEFTLRLRRLEKDVLLENSGLDELTGLRSRGTLKKDYNTEMERVSRQGRPFTLAVVRIANYADIPGDKSAAVKMVADKIKQSMRSFDDAYRISENEFVLSLKQADMKGGLIALNRVHRFVEKESASLLMTSCIAEPTPGDDLDDLVKNIGEELDGLDDGESAIVEYVEMSALQRFVKQGGD